MKQIILFFLSYLMIYSSYYVLVLKKEDKLKKFKKSTELNYLKKVYHINSSHYDLKWLANKIILVNSFIISITVVIAGFASNIILMLLLGFVILFPSIILIYHILGKYLQKMEGRR